ncbi:putative TRAP-type C4-dicarboxylate transport system, periplasmic component [Planococcus sp. PAMC 21323]|uniref:TRAP transporter substrate-binding protein n=1 Tax=Planococcus sp. PAMC 21323 TaxID=1526927 RepID=UPI000571CC45|nr:TRAP transporter substrate-binding protein [Planococcus sp. PAMC 21323]AIY05686.1 putative TRAP-type C4-dicarboxylate transport system, periplasmic component [Planococcus sp. PAMC 21323]
MNKKFGYMAAPLMASVLLLGACSDEGGSEETTTLRLAENQPEDYPTTVGAKEFARLVKEKTDGRYEIEVYAGGQLGEETEIIEQIQLGSMDLTRVNAVPLSEFNDSLGVLSMPYLFEDDTKKWEKLNGEVGRELLDTFEGSNIYGLAFYDSGERSFYNSVKPIETPSDMEGLQIRVQNSDLAIDIIEALGASATPMEYSEVYSALQTGVIDGAENNLPSYFTSNHYEIAEYFTVNGYQGVPEVLLASEKLWGSLSDEDKVAFQEAALESVDVQRETWAELTNEARTTVEEAGSQLIEVEDLSVWREAVQPVYDKYGKEFSEWIEKLSE